MDGGRGGVGVVRWKGRGPGVGCEGGVSVLLWGTVCEKPQRGRGLGGALVG